MPAFARRLNQLWHGAKPKITDKAAPELVGSKRSVGRQSPWHISNQNSAISRHSIMMSACKRMDCGNLKPIALEVFWFRTSSYLLGRSMGESPGLAPLRILST